MFFNHFLVRAAAAGLGMLILGSVGCGDSPAAPGPPPGPPPPQQLTVTSVQPKQGLIGTIVVVVGTGFQSGVTVALDSIPAQATVITEGTIRVIAPVHAEGTVDVVVTNPTGQSARLTGGYTYEVVTLTVSADVVTVGAELRVSWVAPAGRSTADWVGLFKVGDVNTNYLWYVYTAGLTTGTSTLPAPTEPGTYEFRYLLDDDYTDVARSRAVTVKAATSADQ